jgi:heptosyltransferase-1
LQIAPAADARLAARSDERCDANAASRMSRDEATSASDVLVVRPSSLGDIVYALAVVSDIKRTHPAVAVDWVSEPGFAPLIALCPDVRRVITFGLRRWRRAPFAAATWRDFGRFRDALRQTRYATILDLQEQVKGALIARAARGVRHGFDRASIREPLATIFDDVHHRVSRDLHFVTRCRRLAGAALDYSTDAPPRWNLRVPPPGPGTPDRPYVVVLHATSRDDKLWPEANWRAVMDACSHAGFAIVLPWGSAVEEARSRRLAEGNSGAVLPAWLSLPEVATLLSHATLAIGVDTGFTHLAAALGTPTIALFTVTDPRRHGVESTGRHGRDLGDIGVVPSVDDVLRAAGDHLRLSPRC